MTVEKELTRNEALNNLLKPIIWDWSSSVKYRKWLVTMRRDAVKLIYPFLTTEEKYLANKWLMEESYHELWD